MFSVKISYDLRFSHKVIPFLRTTPSSALGHNVTTLPVLYPVTSYADDIVIVARTQKKLTEVYLDLEDETSKLGMEIN